MAISEAKMKMVIENYFRSECNINSTIHDAFKKGFMIGVKKAQSVHHSSMSGCADCKEYDQEKHCCPRWNRVIWDALKDAQPERKKGKWIQHGAKECFLIERYTCSVCSYYSGTKTSNFCPNCGADMRGEEDE